MKYTFKKLTTEDLVLAKDLFLFFQLDDGIAEPSQSEDAYLKNLLAKNSFHVLVALHENKVVGGLTAYELSMYKEEKREMFLYEIGVDSNHRKIGIASKLISQLKAICTRKGISEMYVAAKALDCPAVQLYESTGGKKEDVAWFVYDLKTES